MAKRKAHVKRVYRQDPDTGDIDKNIWLDMLRIDGATFQFRAQNSGKITSTNFNFNWKDDPNKYSDGDKQQENANTSRKTEQIKVKNPDDDSQFIPLWIVDKAKISSRGGLQPGDSSGATNQVANYVFNNKPSDQDGASQSRKFTAVKIVNNDLGGTDNLDMSKGPVDWDTYLNALQIGKKDSGQKLYVEMPDSFTVHFAADALNGVVAQNIKFVENNKDIENLFDLSDSDKTPVRIDPLQMIVNVSWHGLLFSIGVRWNDSAYGPVDSLRVATGTTTTTDTGPGTLKTVVDASWATVNGLTPTIVANSSAAVTVPDHQDSVIKWLNSSVHPQIDTGTGPAGAKMTFAPDITSVHWDSSVDPGAPFTEPYYWATQNPQGGGQPTKFYTQNLYIQPKGGSLDKESSDIIGPVKINMSGNGSMSLFGGSISGTWTWTFTDNGGSTVDSASEGNSQVLDGSPGFQFGAAIYSTDDTIFDQTSQTLKPKDPKKPSQALSVMAITAQSVREQGTDTILAAISSPVTLKLAAKKVGEKIFPILWISAPGPVGVDENGDPYGSYFWNAFNKDGSIAGGAQKIPFGTPP